MTKVRLPRLLDSTLQEIRRLHPVSATVDDRLSPLSTAEMELGPDERVRLRQLVEVYTADGSAGIYRISDTALRSGGMQTVTLKHGLATLEDAIIPGEGEKTGKLRELLEQLLACQTGAIRWSLGDVHVPDDPDLTWEWSDSNALEALTSIMTEVPRCRIVCDQSSLPWVMHIRPLDDTLACECRLSRSLVDYHIAWSDAELCTRLYAPGIDAPFEADTQDEWGVISRRLQVDEELGEELIRKAALHQLEQHKHPGAVITLTARAMAAATGLAIDAFRPGLMCRCCLPDEGIALTERIVSVKHEDVYGDPQDVTLTLSSSAPSVAGALAGLVVDTRYTLRWLEKLDKHLRIEAESIKLLAEQKQVDEIVTRLKRVEIDLNAAEAELLLKAESTDMDAALIRLSGLESEILLKADKVDIEGFLTVNDSAYIAGMLAGSDISCNALTANTSVWTEYISAYETNSTSVTTSYLTFEGSDVAWKQKSVLTGIGTIKQDKHYLNIMLADGSTKWIDIVSDISITPNSSTLKYLGAE